MQPIIWLAEECNGNEICDPMPTAIVRYLTKTGLVITADGKTSGGSLTTPKIFEIKGAPAAYALYGNIGFGDGKENDEPPPLDLGKETANLFNSNALPVHDLLLCSQQLASALKAIILKAKADDLIVYPSFPSEFGMVKFANITLFGYLEGSPVEIDIPFWHRHDVLIDPAPHPSSPIGPRIHARGDVPSFGSSSFQAITGSLGSATLRFLPMQRKSANLTRRGSARTISVPVIATREEHGECAKFANLSAATYT